MTLKQISYETFFQRRFNVSLLFFNVVSTLKQRHCACWGVPRNTVTEQIYHITRRNLSLFSAPIFFSRGGHGRRTFLMDSLIAMELPFLPSVRPMRKCRVGKQNFTQVLPWANYSAAFPRYFNFSRFPHCSVQTVLMMS